MTYSLQHSEFTHVDQAVEHLNRMRASFNAEHGDQDYFDRGFLISMRRRHFVHTSSYMTRSAPAYELDWYQFLASRIIEMANGNRCRVLDFGGASCWYYEIVHQLLGNLGFTDIELSFDVVESPDFVKYLGGEFTRPGVRFFDDVAKTEARYDLAISRGALHIISPPFDPYDVFRVLNDKAPTVVVAKTTVAQDVPGDRFLTWQQSGADFLGAFQPTDRVPTFHRVMALSNLTAIAPLVEMRETPSTLFHYGGKTYHYKDLTFRGATGPHGTA